MKVLTEDDVKKVLLLNSQKVSSCINSSILGNSIRFTVTEATDVFQKEFQKNLANTVIEYIENELKDDPKNYNRSITYTITEQKNVITISI